MMNDNNAVNPYAAWINDLLSNAAKNPNATAEELIAGCGRGCAIRRGAIEGTLKLKAAAVHCQTKSDYVSFLNGAIPAKFSETSDGIIFNLGNKQCNCPMSAKVKTPMLCNCTKSFNETTWSEFFGRPVKVSLIEGILTGGEDCAFKIML